jgi:hypothetical protein
MLQLRVAFELDFHSLSVIEYLCYNSSAVNMTQPSRIRIIQPGNEGYYSNKLQISGMYINGNAKIYEGLATNNLRLGTVTIDTSRLSISSSIILCLVSSSILSSSSSVVTLRGLA